jgi:hypothetical protein
LSARRAFTYWTLAAYVEGELGVSEARAIEAATAGSEELRAELERLRQLRLALGTVDEEVAATDLVPRVREAIAREAPPTRGTGGGSFRFAFALVGGGLACSAAVVLVLFARPDDFRAKGGATVEEDAWVGIHVLRARESGQPVRAEGALSASDALVFAYSNAGPHPFSHLLIFGVDERGEVHWYHPAHENAGADPASRPIEARADVELREAVRHRLRPGPLALYALFSRSPLRVSEVEAAVAGLVRAGTWSARSPRRLAFPQSAQKLVRLEVSPWK